MSPYWIAGIAGFAALVFLAFSVYQGFDFRAQPPYVPFPIAPLPTSALYPTPAPNSACPAQYPPPAPLGVAVSPVGEDRVDVRWSVNHSYSCRGSDGGSVSMACGLPAADFLGYDVYVAWDDGSETDPPQRVPALRGAASAPDPCSFQHWMIATDGKRRGLYQVRAVSSLYVGPWSAPVYYPAAGGSVGPPPTPTATPGPTPTPGGPTNTPHPPGQQRTVWLVAYDPDAGILPGARVPGLPETVAVDAWPPPAGEYLEFTGLPHCSGTKRFWVVWPDSWAEPARYALVSPTGGVAPVMELAWERTLAGVEIQGVDREYWRMNQAWNCTVVAGQHLRVYGGGA